MFCVVGTSRPEASCRRAETKGGNGDSGERECGETERRAGEGEGQHEQRGLEAEDADPGSGGLQRGAHHGTLIPRRKEADSVSRDASGNFLFSVFAARGPEARGGRAGAAGGQAAGGGAPGPARQHPRPNRAAAAPGAADPAGWCSAMFPESLSHLRFFLPRHVREDPQQEVCLSMNTQERMRLRHVQKESERPRLDPVTSSPVAPGVVMFGFPHSCFFLLICLM